MRAIKQQIKNLLNNITRNSVTEDLKDNFVRAKLIDDTTKPMLEYTNSMIKLRAKINREDAEMVKLFNEAHQGAMDAYGMLLNLVAVYDEHYQGMLISSHNRGIQLKVQKDFITREEVEELQDTFIKLKDNNAKYKVKSRKAKQDLLDTAVEKLVMGKVEINRLKEQLEALTT